MVTTGEERILEQRLIGIFCMSVTNDTKVWKVNIIPGPDIGKNFSIQVNNIGPKDYWSKNKIFINNLSIYAVK